jgi:hypothetical protein
LGNEGSPKTCSSKLERGTSKVWSKPGLVPVPTGEDVILGHVPLILADIHVVKFGLVAGLDLYLLSDLAGGIDPMAFEKAEDGSKAALLRFEAALQDLDHFPVTGRIPEVHVERGWIGDADLGQSLLAAPQLHAALEVRIEDPYPAFTPDLFLPKQI